MKDLGRRVEADILVWNNFWFLPGIVFVGTYEHMISAHFTKGKVAQVDLW
jgi:hypothetical protein